MSYPIFPRVLNIHLFSTHCVPGIMSAFCGHTLRCLSAVLTVWFGFPIASISGYYTGGVCTTLFGYCVFTYVLLVGSLMGRVIPSSPFKEHSVWHHSSCSVMFTDELKEGLVPVFGENVLVGRNEVLLVQRKNNLFYLFIYFFTVRMTFIVCSGKWKRGYDSSGSWGGSTDQTTLQERTI